MAEALNVGGLLSHNLAILLERQPEEGFDGGCGYFAKIRRGLSAHDGKDALEMFAFGGKAEGDEEFGLSLGAIFQLRQRGQDKAPKDGIYSRAKQLRNEAGLLPFERYSASTRSPLRRMMALVSLR